MSRYLVPAQRLVRALSNELPAYELTPQPITPPRPPARTAQAAPPTGGGGDEPPVWLADTLAVDPLIAEKFGNYAPSYFTKIGAVTCKLTGLRNIDGETVGEYTLEVRDRVDRTIETTRYFYAYRHERFVKVGEMPSTTRAM